MGTASSMSERRRELAADPRSNEVLIAEALKSWALETTDDAVNDATAALWIIAARGTRRELDVLVRLSRSPSALERELAAFALGRLGYDEHVLMDEVFEPLIALTHDVDSDVVETALYALGQTRRPGAMPRLIELASSSVADIREAVAYAIDMQGDPEGVPVLMRLMQDSHARNRDWATFAFNNGYAEYDSAEIRDALIARTNDEDYEVRGEALMALAARRDPRVVEKIRRELAGEFNGTWAAEAAAGIGDPSLLPVLVATRQRLSSAEDPWVIAAVDDAIAKLREGQRPLGSES
jgi:hypothetical protein